MEPASIRASCSLLAGSTRRALAVRMLSSLLLHWLPVVEAVGRGSEGLQVTVARWYSGRGSRETGKPSWEVCEFVMCLRELCVFSLGLWVLVIDISWQPKKETGIREYGSTLYIGIGIIASVGHGRHLDWYGGEVRLLPAGHFPQCRKNKEVECHHWRYWVTWEWNSTDLWCMLFMLLYIHAYIIILWLLLVYTWFSIHVYIKAVNTLYLPGRAKTSFVLPPLSTVANVVGFLWVCVL